MIQELLNEECLKNEVKRKAMLEHSAESKAVFAIVSTNTALLLVNLNTKDVMPLKSDYVDYFGISWFPNGTDLVLSNNMLQAKGLVNDNNPLLNLVLSEIGILSYGSIETPPFLADPHQILCASDGKVICTNTGRNSLSILDLAKPHIVQDIKVSSQRWDRITLDDGSKEEGDHLNSVFEKDKHLYVVAHGNNKGSSLVTLTYPGLELIAIQPVKDHKHLHNIWVTNDGQKISCGSEKGQLIEIGQEKAITLWKSGTHIFTRGLAAAADFVLVGETQVTPKIQRGNSVAGLWLLDRKNWQAIDYFYLGPYGAVHDVRLLSIPDEAHHKHPFQGLETLLTQSIAQTTVQKKVKIANAIQSEGLNLGDRITFGFDYKNFSSYSKLGETFSSSRFNSLLGHGWSSVEDWGVWTSEDTATFIIMAKHLPPQFKIKLGYMGFVTAAYARQSYEFSNYQGEVLQTCDFRYGNELQEVILNINQQKDSHHNENKVEITIKMLNATSPQSLNMGEDSRKLGFALISIEILL